DDHTVKVDMSLTSPNCPSAQELPVMVQNAVSTVPGGGKGRCQRGRGPTLGPEPNVGGSARCPQHVVSYLSSRSPHIAVDLLRFETGSENMMARLRPQMMRLTDAAANRIKSVMANAGRPIVGVRVGVKNGGCAGMAYTMEYAE